MTPWLKTTGATMSRRGDTVKDFEPATLWAIVGDLLAEPGRGLNFEPGTLSQGIETMNLVLYRSEEMANLALCGGIGCRAGNVNLASSFQVAWHRTASKSSDLRRISGRGR
jgi:hypothetical protein